jgi:hypothetical protein
MKQEKDRWSNLEHKLKTLERKSENSHRNNLSSLGGGGNNLIWASDNSIQKENSLTKVNLEVDYKKISHLNQA